MSRRQYSSSVNHSDKTTKKAEKRRTVIPAIAISFLRTCWNYVASMKSPDPYASMK